MFPSHDPHADIIIFCIVSRFHSKEMGNVLMVS
jgi:hypothetical protein